jgi:pimeloyl-ACP methyl ester carboxylesterase
MRFPRPVIAVTGADDIAPGLDASKVQAESARSGRLHTVLKSGHFVRLEQPEYLNSLLEQVIATCRCGCPNAIVK